MSTHPHDLNVLASTVQLPGKMKLGMWFAGILFAAFGLFTIQFAFALNAGTMPWATSLTALILQHPPEVVAKAHLRLWKLPQSLPSHQPQTGRVSFDPM